MSENSLPGSLSPASRALELLAPAGNAEIARQAILHGADAVYIGPPSHGARSAASNSIADIRSLAEFAHLYGAKVYVTVNTIIYENELKAVEKMVGELYRAQVDALIVQDMALLRMDIPPIALHASTQCDIRTPEKARFLQEAGFSQLVLARELSIGEIRAICDAVTIPVETFVHGALCTSFSGRCGAGFIAQGRSGNRGECPQVCRQQFTLSDADGKILAKDKYLLSLKDFQAYPLLPQLVEAGVSSFKIEGRLKDAAYVKNVTAAYSRRLDRIIAESNGTLQRSSFGSSDLTFTPDLQKSFNRGFTQYMLHGRPDRLGIASIHTPKSLGQKITDIRQLKPGDGISFLSPDGKYDGLLVNRIENGRIIGNRPVSIPAGTEIRRTSSVEWKKAMAGDTAKRKIEVDISFDSSGITATTPYGHLVRTGHFMKGEAAEKPADYTKIFTKTGTTPFKTASFTNSSPGIFFPSSYLTEKRRELLRLLEADIRATYRFDKRRTENKAYPFPYKTLDFRDNVANSLAVQFYRDHGADPDVKALEISKSPALDKVPVMTSRHCVLRELGMCLKNNRLRQPLILRSGPLKFRLGFDCKNCEMQVFG